MYKELTKVLKESSTNEQVTCLVITGNGDFYSSGNDFSESMMSDEPTDVDERISTLQFV